MIRSTATKDSLREEIQRQTVIFLAHGGEIKEIESHEEPRRTNEAYVHIRLDDTEEEDFS